jgi:chitinase
MSKLIVYYTNWSTYERNYQVSDIPVQYVTNINYSFLKLSLKGDYHVPCFSDSWADLEKPTSTGLKGNLAQFEMLKKSHNFSLALTIGGWSFSRYFSKAVESKASRAAFINETINILQKYPVFTSIDLDWEFPSPPGCSYGDPGNIVGNDDRIHYIT